MKICGKCKEEKELSEFHKNKNRGDGRRSWCKPCVSLYSKKRRESPKGKAQTKNYLLKKNYGLSLEDYNDVLYAQKGCCAVCKIHHTEFKRALAIDHNHATGEIRGLLCTKCNLMIGHSRESKTILLAGVEYLRLYD